VQRVEHGKAQGVVSVHAVPGSAAAVVPAMAAVIHEKVDPNRNSPSATTLLNVHILPPLKVWTGRSLSDLGVAVWADRSCGDDCGVMLVGW
jgi:hypothetical protein